MASSCGRESFITMLELGSHRRLKEDINAVEALKCYENEAELTGDLFFLNSVDTMDSFLKKMVLVFYLCARGMHYFFLML